MTAKPPIILIGMKSSGKTTVGRLLARRLGRCFDDMDAEIERWHSREQGESLRFRDIFRRYGRDYFRKLETAALQHLCAHPPEFPLVLATGGGLPLAEENRPLLRQLGPMVFLDVPQAVLLPRILAHGVPAFFPYPEDPERSLAELLAQRRPVYQSLAAITIECGDKSQETITREIINQLHQNGCDY